MLYADSSVEEVTIDYSHCESLANTTAYSEVPSKYVSYSFKGGQEPDNKPQWMLIEHDSNYTVASSGVNIPVERTCRIQFDVPTEMGPSVYVFYRLTNFFQNHRRYVKSFNEKQLKGEAQTADQLRSKDDCKPLIVNSDGVPYYPCGLIANSFFNDTISTLTLLNAPNVPGGRQTYNMTDKGISWSSDRNLYKKTSYNASDVVPPPDWAKLFPNNYTDENMPDLSTWEPLQNWMRTAGLPTFNKLALRNDDEVLKAGTYSVDIGLNFPILVYEGTKTIVISTSTVLGGSNPFFGIAYLVVAGVCFLLGVLFLIKHLISPRKLGDHSFLNWNDDNAQGTGTGAGGRDRDSIRAR